MSTPDSAVVLVVDDDPGVTQTFARILRLSGYEVQTALTGQMALEQFDAIHPDVVLLDLRMPLVDGLAVLRSLREHEREGQTPVGIITGDYALDDALRLELYTLGASIYFKPVWLQDLLGITSELLGKAH